MTTFVHLVEGDDASARQARVIELTEASRQTPSVFAELAGHAPCPPLAWFEGPGCGCCLPAAHPRRRLLAIATQPGRQRVVIDAGPPTVSGCLIAILRAMPVTLLIRVHST